MKKLSSFLFLVSIFFLGFSDFALAGKVTIGGVNIDGRQYGGIHSSGGMSGSIYQSEEFHMHGGNIKYRNSDPQDNFKRRDNIFVPNIEIDNVQPKTQTENTTISKVLRNIYENIGRFKVYRNEGRFNIMIGEVGAENPSAYICKSVEDFCSGISSKEISFQAETGRVWVLTKNKEGDLFIEGW